MAFSSLRLCTVFYIMETIRAVISKGRKLRKSQAGTWACMRCGENIRLPDHLRPFMMWPTSNWFSGHPLTTAHSHHAQYRPHYFLVLNNRFCLHRPPPTPKQGPFCTCNSHHWLFFFNCLGYKHLTIFQELAQAPLHYKPYLILLHELTSPCSGLPHHTLYRLP